jgi:hypothetical protein
VCAAIQGPSLGSRSGPSPPEGQLFLLHSPHYVDFFKFWSSRRSARSSGHRRRIVIDSRGIHGDIRWLTSAFGHTRIHEAANGHPASTQLFRVLPRVFSACYHISASRPCSLKFWIGRSIRQVEKRDPPWMPLSLSGRMGSEHGVAHLPVRIERNDQSLGVVARPYGEGFSPFLGRPPDQSLNNPFWRCT